MQSFCRKITSLRSSLFGFKVFHDTGLKKLQGVLTKSSTSSAGCRVEIPISNHCSRRLHLFAATRRSLQPVASHCISDKLKILNYRKLSGSNMNSIETPQKAGYKNSPRWPWILAGIAGFGALYTANALKSDEIYRRAVTDLERGNQTVSLNALQVAAPTLFP
jgi:hypothetical protein